jgi:DNA invertase Pin-like site-specific DNA recombinase
VSVEHLPVAEGSTNVFVYLRTSTDEQDMSPEIQEKRVRAFCTTQGWAVAGVYYDVASGATPVRLRPRFQKLLRDAPAAGVVGVVALSLDRFLRSLEVKAEMEAELRKLGLFATGVDDGMWLGATAGKGRRKANDIVKVNVAAIFSQYFRDFIGDKIVDHHQHRVGMKLHHSGAPPFGYRLQKDAVVVDGRPYDGWVPDDGLDGTDTGMTLAGRVTWIFEQFLASESLMAVACELTKMRVPTPRLVQWNRLSASEQSRRLEIQAKNRAAGKAVMALPPTRVWDSSVLSDMVRSRVYLGEIAYSPDHAKEPGRQKAKEWHEGVHPPLITRELHERARAVLEQRHQARRKPPTPGTESMLTGMLRCWCGNALTKTPKSQGTNVWRYRCNLRKKSRGAACTFQGVNSGLVEPLVLALLLRGLNARAHELQAAAARTAAGGGPGDLAGERQALVRKRDRVLENFEDGMFGEGAGAKAERDARLAPVLRRLAEIDAELAPPPARQEALQDEAARLASGWAGLDVARRREILRTHVPDGFRLTPAGTLHAVVCGLPLEAAVPANEPTRPGVKYGGRKAKAAAAPQQEPALPDGMVAFKRPRGRPPKADGKRNRSG